MKVTKALLILPAILLLVLLTGFVSAGGYGYGYGNSYNQGYGMSGPYRLHYDYQEPMIKSNHGYGYGNYVAPNKLHDYFKYGKAPSYAIVHHMPYKQVNVRHIYFEPRQQVRYFQTAPYFASHYY